jgi:hypothetical protein
MIRKWPNMSKLTVAVASTVLVLLLALPSMAQVHSTAPGPDPLMTPTQIDYGVNGSYFWCNPDLTESCGVVTKLAPFEGNAGTSPTVKSVLVADKYVFVLFSSGLLRRCLSNTTYYCNQLRRCWPQTTYSCIDFGNLKENLGTNMCCGAMAVLREGTIIVASSTNMVRTRTW